ncbi:hypothetical protein N7507_004637 [Penicillium longicatenatum]|nr:hypothetical protein N7507_004637 [Penicillium longicatenatum]
MRLSIFTVVSALLSGIAQALPTEVDLQSNAGASISSFLSSEDEPLSVNQIKELVARSPDIHQDPYNITDVDAYHALYKRSTGCDPIGCFDGSFFSVIFHYSGENGVYLYGAGFNSWLPWVFSSRLLPNGIFACARSKNRAHIYIKYASIDENLSGDARCGDNGGVDGGVTNARCIFPIHP